MSRKIYPYGGHPPIPGTVEKTKMSNGSLGRMKLRIKKRVRKQRRLAERKEINAIHN